MKRGGAEPDQRDPLPVEHRDVAHNLTGQPMPQPVMRIELSVKAVDLRPRNRTDQHIRDPGTRHLTGCTSSQATTPVATRYPSEIT